MERIRSFWKLRKSGHKLPAICRVSDLVENGYDIEKLVDEFARLNQEVWGDITDQRYLWTKDKLKSHFEICPQHIYCAFENGKMVASLTSMATTEEDMRKNKTWLEKTGDGYLTTHRANGDIGFGVDLSVSRKASNKVSDRIVLAALFISALGEGVKAVYLGARIPGYHKNRQLTVEEYVYGKRKNGKPLDPELYFYLKNGFELVEIIPEYMEDPESLNYGVLIRWGNPLYKITKTIPFLKAIIIFIGKSLFLHTSKIKSSMFKANCQSK
jgi:hypothetical protein